MHEKRTADIQFLVLRLIIRHVLWSRKYGNISANFASILSFCC